MSWVFALSGSVEVSVSAASRMAFLNLCLYHGIQYRNFRYREDGGVACRMAYLTAHRLRRLCAREGIEMVLSQPRGLPAFLFGLRRRAGLLAGSAVAICLLVLSSRFLWDIEITGNTQMTKEEIRSVLADCSFSVGSYLPDVKIRELENRVLLAAPDIAWIAINLQGTVAEVQVIERETSEPTDTTKPANMIAAADGQIEFLQLYRGNAVVTVGQAVKKGELLISGIYDSATEGFRFTRAAGEVLARTEHTYRIEIPLTYEEKAYGEREYRSVSLHFFDFSSEFFKKTGNQSDTCDIIKNEIEFGWFGTRPVPLSLSVLYAEPYTMQTRTRSEEEAVELAYAELERELTELSARAELLQKEVRTEITADAVILHCRVKVIENIAVQSEFEIRD